MTAYHTTLGVSLDASREEIQKAYRKLAMQHHPDRGGNEDEFKNINTAYAKLLKQAPDDSAFKSTDENVYKYTYTNDQYNDFFSFTNTHNSNFKPNNDITVKVQVTLEDVLHGKTIDAELSYNGLSKVVNITIPPGILNGKIIKYAGLGESHNDFQKPGNLFVEVVELPHKRFNRKNDTLYLTEKVDVFDAILGTTLHIKTLENKTLSLKIPPGCRPGTILSCKGYGLPKPNSSKRGSLYVIVDFNMPTQLSSQQIALINEIKNA